MPARARLTRNQYVILKCAARRKNGAVLSQDLDLKGATRANVLRSLCDRGLIEPDAKASKPGSRHGNQAINYNITNKARAALKAAKTGELRSLPNPVLKAAQSTKAGVILELLSKPGGAGIEALMTATGWRAHSVRAALSRLRKHGIRIIHDRAGNRSTIYRIEKESL